MPEKPASGNSLVALVDERTAAQENAARQVGHLAREVSYGYPPARIREMRRAANAAVTKYIEACDAVNREARRAR